MIERMNGPQDRSRNLLLVGERPSTHPLALDWIPQLWSAIPRETNRAGTSPPGKMGGEDSERPQTVSLSRCGEFPEVNLRIFRVGVISNLS